MKIEKLLGGLWNQMFEYAMYLVLKEEHPNEEIKHCTRSFRCYGVYNGLELPCIFHVNKRDASLWDLCKVAYHFFSYRMWKVMLLFFPQNEIYDIWYDSSTIQSF